jgi:hypothetical protein
MPVPLGKFISLHVYDGNLNSQHKSHDMACLSFVDASNGEEEKAGFSWKVSRLNYMSCLNLNELTVPTQNAQEIKTIVHLVRSYYRHTNFCVITPYDAQRAAIEGQLKSENLPWERVFNVDSFQGISSVSAKQTLYLPQSRKRSGLRPYIGSKVVSTWISNFAQSHERHAHSVPCWARCCHKQLLFAGRWGADTSWEVSSTLGSYPWFGQDVGRLADGSGRGGRFAWLART